MHVTFGFKTEVIMFTVAQRITFNLLWGENLKGNEVGATVNCML
jgi:hypothetical protein